MTTGRINQVAAVPAGSLAPRGAGLSAAQPRERGSCFWLPSGACRQGSPVASLKHHLPPRRNRREPHECVGPSRGAGNTALLTKAAMPGLEAT